MASNPNPARITGAVWRLWEDTRDAIGDIQLGGIWASKPGYHNSRAGNDDDDYSVADHAADHLGPPDKSAGLDLTFPEAHRGDYHRIQLVTKRVVEAARARDPRIYRDGVPVIREVIGNIGGQAKAYDLYDRAEDHRDDSHLWHIHLSITRKFVGDWPALAGLVEIMAGVDDVSAEEVWTEKIPDSAFSKAAFPDWSKEGVNSARVYLRTGTTYAKLTHQAVAQLTAQVGALTAAVGKLAEAQGTSPDEVRAAAEAGARAALADVQISWSTVPDGE